MPPVISWSARYCRFIARRARLVLIIGGAFFLAAVGLASRLELHTAFHELLPSNDPGVVALMRTEGRIPDLSLLLIGVRSPDKEANLRYAEQLTNKLRALPPSVVTFATYHVRDIRDFVDRNKWLYLSETDLDEIRDRLRREIGKKKNPLMVDLSDDEPVDQLKDRLAAKDQIAGKFPGGVFSNKDGSYVWVAAQPPGGIFGEHTGESLYRAAQRLVKQQDPHAFHPQMAVELLGPVATALNTREAVERDILWVTLCCAAVVAFSLALYFRRLRAIPLVGIPAVLGTVTAFAVAELAFGYVNSSTAFLGSIILGNGINYSIIFMSRYQEERASGASPGEALEHALGGTASGTGVAAVCASAAYATLMLTSFRGFFQFGVMGAAGVLCCWLATFTVLPALLFLLDQRSQREVRRAPISLAGVGRLVARRAPLFLVLSVVATLLSTRGVLHFGAAPFEYDFRKLNVRTKPTDQMQQFNDQQEGMFGRWPQPYIVLADNAKDVEAIKQAIRQQDKAAKGPNVIGQIVTINDVLPGTPEEQQRKLALLAQIRKLKNDPALELASQKDRDQLAKIDPPANLRVLTPSDLPTLALRIFTEPDGSVGRVVLVYYIEQGLSVWNGQDLLRIASVIQKIHLPDGRVIDTSGNAVVFSAMLRSILRDGPIATAASLAVVLILILLIMRPMRAALMAIGSLLVGVIWMVGAAGWAEVKITFLNFIALPITFGIGAEYAINVVSRYQQGKDMVRAVSSTGSAVALCSWTTIVGYGSLLAARNRALQGFGAMAILGEVACLAAAIIGLPSMVLWLGRRGKATHRPAAASSENGHAAASNGQRAAGETRATTDGPQPVE
jgi:predicted RND superfamily exporter protein